MIRAVAERPYEAVARTLSAAGSRDERMAAVVDALWDGLRDTGVTWVGFYVDRPDEPDDHRLVLGPCRDKTACSPLGLHGICGQAVRFRQPRIVDDCSSLGEEYIACDPRDRSEICVPLLEDSGVCWGVLDLDSYEVGAFGASDEQGLRLVLEAAGL